MKKTLFLILFSLILTSTYAQERRGEKLKALKVAFITEQLDLTQTEAQKFWPIYNAFEEKERELRRDNFMERKKLKPEELTEEDAQKLIDEFVKNENELHQNKQKLVEDLRKVLPAKKIILLKKAEDDYAKADKAHSNKMAE